MSPAFVKIAQKSEMYHLTGKRSILVRIILLKRVLMPFERKQANWHLCWWRHGCGWDNCVSCLWRHLPIDRVLIYLLYFFLIFLDSIVTVKAICLCFFKGKNNITSLNFNIEIYGFHICIKVKIIYFLPLFKSQKNVYRELDRARTFYLGQRSAKKWCDVACVVDVTLLVLLTWQCICCGPA